MTGDKAAIELPSELNQLKADISQLNDQMDNLDYLLQAATDGLMLIGADGRIVFVNQAMERIAGFGKADMIGQKYDDARWNFQDVFDDCNIGESVFKTVFDSAAGELQGRVCRKAGKTDGNGRFVINARARCDARGKVTSIAAMVQDVIANSEAKGENTDIKNVYERLAAYSDEAIIRIQVVSGRIVYVNDAAVKILGYSLENYQSDPSLQEKLFSVNSLQKWIEALGTNGAAKDVLKNIAVECTSRDGRTVIMDFTVIAIRDVKGAIDYFECLGRDETVNRFMEAELARSQKLESIGLLAGGIAHDFNNILTAIFGSLALAKMDTAPENPIYARLSSAEDHCMKAKALTRKLLTYSRGGSLQRKTAAIDHVIRDAVNFTLSGKNIDCRFDLPEGLWSAQIDEGQMHQVVHSLVSNACESMPNGGIIDVGAENVTLYADQIPSLMPGNYVKWYVRDHGVGISPDHMKKIFDPYFTTKQMGSIKGMGLGLAICYSVVKSHDGIIAVESTPGAGTIFTVYIPAVNGHKTEAKPKEIRSEAVLPRPRILLIDDEQILLDVTGSMLKHLGYEVTTAKSHSQAMEDYRLAKLEGNPFALIIMDLTMRGDEGGEIAIRRWKSAHPEVKAVISSGYMNDPVLEEYWKYGFIGAMVKPYSLIELKGSLEKFLTGGGK